MTSKAATTFLVLLAWICFASQCHADVGSQRQNRQYRLQRQQLQETPYPAAGYRPGRQFTLPQEQQQQQQKEQEQQFDESNTINTEETLSRRPHATYDAPSELSQPARLTQGLQQFQPLEQQQQFFFGTGSVPRRKSERLTAAAPKFARLAVNNENVQELDEAEIESDIEVDKKTENVPRTAPANPQSSTVYYPAGAVSFVQPLPATAYIQPAQLPAAAIPQPAATVIAQPTAANYVQQLQYANFQVQPVAATATVPAATMVQTAASKLQVRPVTAAKLEAQPVTTTTFAAPTPVAATAAPYFATSAAYTASPSYFTAPSAAYTVPFAQQQFYVPASAAAMTQLQAW